MQARFQNRLLSATLIVVGGCAAAWTGLELLDHEELDAPLNPFGVNRSPYGEIFAMALQGPINKNFHVGMFGATPEEIVQRQKENPVEKPGSLLIVKPDPDEQDRESKQAPKGVLGHMEHLINQMQVGLVRRTNRLPASELLKAHLRRQAEDKLRLAYNLDPSHYANYNALHFFLAEGITTRPELVKHSIELAQETIDYCLSIDYDPRPSLTAAAACTNILHYMFKAERLNEEKQYSPEEMDAVIADLDECIATYHRIAAQWDENGNWQRLSPQRVYDCQQRIRFITKIRDAAVITVERIRKTHSNE